MGQFGQNGLKDFMSNWKASRSLDKQHRTVAPSNSEKSHPVVWGLRFLVVLAVFLIPWRNGFLAWSSQWWLVHVGLGMLFLLPILLAFLFKKLPGIHVPGMVVILSAIAGLAIFQSLPIFPRSFSGNPNSVRLQQWSLGDNVSLRSGWYSNATIESLKLDQEASQPTSNGYLPISMCQNDTLAGIGALALSALCIWLGSILFAEARSQSLLLHGIAFSALMVTGLLFMETIAWQALPWATLDSRKLVGTFTNKNAAGAFLSVGLAAAIGLTGNSLRLLRKAKSNRMRYPVDSISPAARLLKQLSDFLNGIQTPHIAYFLLTIVIFSGILATLSRGAGVACIVAACAFIAVYASKKSSNWSIGMGIGGLVLLAIIVLAFLDLDREVASRYESILDGETLADRGRLYIYLVSIKAAAYYWLTGCGFSNFGYGTLPFFEASGIEWHRYSESIWGNMIVEFGIFGLIAIALTIIELRRLSQIAFATSRYRSEYAIFYACIFGMTYTLIHNAVDFRLIVPAVFIPSSLLLGALYGSVNSTPLRKPKPRDQASLRPENSDEEKVESKEQELLLAMERLKSKRQRKQNKEKKNVYELPVFAATRFRAFGMNGAICLLFLGICLVLSRNPIANGAFGEQLESWSAENGPQATLFELNSILTQLDSRPTTDWNVHAKRIQGNLKLKYWQRRYEQIISEVDQRKTTEAESSPFVNRLVLLLKNEAIEKQIQRYGGSNLFLPMKEAGVCFSEASKLAPLDWRAVHGTAVWDLDASRELMLSRLNRFRPLAQHRPIDLVDAGIMAELLGDRRLADGCFADATRLNSQVSQRIGRFLFPRLGESILSERILPNDVMGLKGLIKLPEYQVLNKANQEQIWQQVEMVLQQPIGMHPARFFLAYHLALRKSNDEEAAMWLDRWKSAYPGDSDFPKIENSSSR